VHDTTSLDSAASLGLALDIHDRASYDRAIVRCRELGVVLPTIAQLADPSSIPSARREALARADPQAPDARNLFRVHWYNALDGTIVGLPEHLELPPALTGVDARIVLLFGNRFPMVAAHKVLAAYACLVPRLVTGRFDPTRHRAVWPSTGNYARGGVAISRIMGCRGVAVLPAGMSRERFAWLERWIDHPDDVIRTPGTESNVKEIYDECARLRADDRNVILNQFCEFGNHLGHHAITGPALERVFAHVTRADAGARLAAFVSASGSAGTLGAGDFLKERHGSLIAAVEALECPTMLENGYGEHNIQGIGDKHIPLIHNVMNTDVVVAVSDRSTDRLDVLFNTDTGRRWLASRGVPPDVVEQLTHLGLSSICNLIAAIKVAKRRGFGRDDVVMTVATDGSALYDSERARTLHRDFGGAFDERAAAATFADHLAAVDTAHMIDCTDADRRRIFNLGYYTWVEQQGVSLDDFDARRSQTFWRSIRGFVPQWDEAIRDFNARTGVGPSG
jgi:cysteine synthase